MVCHGLRTIQEIKERHPGEKRRLAFALRGREGLSDEIGTETQGREGGSPFCKSERRCGEAGSSQPRLQEKACVGLSETA